MDIYYKSVGRNATLIVGLTPDDRGLLPTADVERLQEWGKEINRRFSKPIATTTGTRGKQFLLKLDREQAINHCLIQEELSLGERVRHYKVEAKVGSKWVTLCQGESVGHKRIEEFDAVTTSQVRLVITEARDQAQIKNFSVFNIE